jgi:phosphoglycolate phosphatase
VDIEAAHGAGIPIAAVATGEYDADELRAAGADHVLATLEEPLPV